MNPWKVIGFEKFLNDNGEECVRLYVVRPLSPEEGHSGDGFETQRLFYKTKYVKYDPVINHLIVDVPGRYGISNIAVVGVDAPK